MDDPPTGRPLGLRERKKAQTRRTIQEHALRLFLTQGYETTTVGQIARAAGVSHMTFFRYFPVKEAVVDTDDYDPLIARLITERPPEEDPLTALHRALTHGLTAVYATDRDALLTRTRLILTTPALRARLWDNQYATERLFAEALAARLDGEVTLTLRVLAAAALAALTTALATWVDGDGAENLPDLADRAFLALRGAQDEEGPAFTGPAPETQ
ncbi:TetR family transcriptional regulator [Streptomyces sp. ACA25]|uniref:acyl-CoA-like ligand-binding transcription factor n=1 Tax=Streptomyces sp. ACA25 TaxID=3022596 RepID=UPI0023082A32|nr:TetR family transcriptional regulator [Streptomyces sp. ACA25]MDB1087684.1 TetR family transcriptional regulator [Streptomyces sp. ACA25]